MATTRKKEAGFRMLPHYAALLAWVWEQRFVAARHLPLRFPEQIRSLRTARYQCRQLVANGYLGEIPVRGVDPTFEKTFVTLGKGLAVISEAYARLTGRPWPGDGGEQLRAARGYGLPFVRHELLTTDASVYLWQMAHGRDDVAIGSTERRYHQRARWLRYSVDSREKHLEPDAGYPVVRRGRDGRRWFELWFLEADRGTMRLEPVMREKLAAYEQWANSEPGQFYLRRLAGAHGDRVTARPNFRLLMLVQHRPGERDDWWRLVKLFTQGVDRSPAMRRRLWFTTAEALARQLARRTPGEPIWYRGKDTAGWLEDYRQMGSALSGRSRAEITAARHQFVAGRLRRQRRLALVPPIRTARNDVESP